MLDGRPGEGGVRVRGPQRRVPGPAEVWSVGGIRINALSPAEMAADSEGTVAAPPHGRHRIVGSRRRPSARAPNSLAQTGGGWVPGPVERGLPRDGSSGGGVGE